MGKFLNRHPFKHICESGMTVIADRCDFKGGVTIECSVHASELAIAKSFGEAMADHALNILPQLNGFNGYRKLDLTIEKRERG